MAAEHDNRSAKGAPRRRHRGRRIVVATGITFVILLLAIVTLAGGALYWLGSESGIRFLMARLEGPLANAGQELRIDDPAGSLWDELRLPRMFWRGGGIEVSAGDLLLRWSPRALLQGRVQVAEISASHLTVRLSPPTADPPPAQPATMPGPFGLPAVVQIDRIAVGELRLVPGTPPGQPPDQPSPGPIMVRDIAAGVGYSDGRFRVSGLGATTQWGRLQSANAELGAAAPHPLRVDATVRGEVARIAYDLALAANGDLEKAVASIDGRAADAAVRVDAELVPLAAMPLSAARVALDGLDLARLTVVPAAGARADGARADGATARLPQTRIEARLQVAPRVASPAGPPTAWDGRLTLRNAASGGLADGKLPLTTIETAIEWVAADDPTAQRLRLEGLRLTLPGPAAGAKAAATGARGTARAGASSRSRGDGSAPSSRADQPAKVDQGSEVDKSPDATISGSIDLHPNRRLKLVGSEIPEVTAALAFERLDVSRLAAQLPATALDGKLDVDRDRFVLALAQSAERMRALLPAAAAQPAEIVARGRIDAVAVTLDEARVRLGASTITASGEAGAEAPHRLRFKGALRRVDLAQWLPPDLAIEPRLRTGRINADWSVDGSVLPGFDGTVAIKIADSTLGGDPLAAELRTQLRLGGSWQPQQITGTMADLRLGKNRVRTRGALGQAADKLALDVELPVLARLDDRVSGRATVAGELAGPFDRLRVRATVAGDDLRLRQPDGEVRIASVRIEAYGPVTARPPAQAPVSARVRLRGGRAAGQTLDLLDLKADGTVGSHRFDIAAEAEGHALALAGNGAAALQAQPSWRARLATLTLDGRVPAKLRGPAEIRIDPETVRVERFDLEVAGGEVGIDRFNLVTGTKTQFDARGGIRELPIARVLRIAGADPGLDALRALRLDVSWDLRGTGAQDLSGDARLDLHEAAQDPASGGSLGLAGDNGARVRLDKGRVDGRIDLSLPSLAFTHRLTAPDLVVDGRLKLAGTLGGTVTRPLYDVTLNGEDLAILQRSVGWRLTDGSITTRFFGRALELQRLRFASGDGSVELEGRANLLDAPRPGARSPVAARSARKPTMPDGVAAKEADKPSVLPLDGEFELVMTRFVVPIGPGQRVALSGSTRLTSGADGLGLRGKLRVDQGIIEIQGSTAPSLPPDVKVVDAGTVGNPGDGKTQPDGKAAKDEQEATSARATRILTELAIDLGDRLRVTGNGVLARLTGELRMLGLLPDQPRLVGLVTVVDGSYQAYGQNLQVDKGRVRFNGPIDNPALDIRAKRPYLPVEVGVEVTGTALDPKVALFSSPEMSETDKLSWLVLGVDPKQAPSAAQSLVLRQAATAMLDDDGSYKPGVAARLGLDVLNFGYGSDPRMTQGVKESMAPTGLPGAATGSTAAAAQQEVVTLGKRIGSRLFVSYEQGVRGVWNLLRIQYTLTQRLSVRAQSGSDNALDLLYSFSFD